MNIINIKSALTISIVLIISIVGCKKETATTKEDIVEISESEQAVLTEIFKGKINLLSPNNYANQSKPAYITKDNTNGNSINDKTATLGRVLFYDQKLSNKNTISCSNCHQQQFAFGDTSVASVGVNGTTGRHSMRLVNARFSNLQSFFWDKRAATLEIQTTKPIQDHAEMGYSGTLGDEGFDQLISKLSTINYYQILFKGAFGSSEITESRIQLALAQFIRSIQSFDSKFDIGRAAAPNNNARFTNYTQEENDGKTLFITAPVFDANGNRTSGGFGCQGCHAAPEFDIDPRTLNNGIIAKIGGGVDLTNTRSPSLRDLFNNNGISNGPFMHTGSFNIIPVLDHYNNITTAGNNNLDPRLRGGPTAQGQKLNMTPTEKQSVVAFLRTLSGTQIYTDTKWSNPF